MAQIRDIVVKFNERQAEKEDERSFIKGVIVSYGGNVTVPGRPSMCYVKELNLDEAGPFPVVNLATSHTEGLRVLLGWTAKPPYGERVVFGEDNSDVLPAGDGTTFSINNHAGIHQYVNESNVGRDPVLVYQAALQMLKTTWTSGLTVGVYGLTYEHNFVRRYFSGQSIDLTSYVPSTANKNVSLLLSLNKSTNSITVTEGNETTVGVDPPKPDIPEGHLASCYIVLENGQSTIDFTTDYTDARSFLTQNTTLEDDATQIGQILYSIDGLTFSPQLPMVSGTGDIMTTSDGIIMVV